MWGAFPGNRGGGSERPFVNCVRYSPQSRAAAWQCLAGGWRWFASASQKRLRPRGIQGLARNCHGHRRQFRQRSVDAISEDGLCCRPPCFVPWRLRFQDSREAELFVARRVGGLFENAKSPSLTLLDVAFFGNGRRRKCWCRKEFLARPGKRRIPR